MEIIKKTNLIDLVNNLDTLYREGTLASLRMVINQKEYQTDDLLIITEEELNDLISIVLIIKEGSKFIGFYNNNDNYLYLKEDNKYLNRFLEVIK